jgi:hypothetical protein
MIFQMHCGELLLAMSTALHKESGGRAAESEGISSAFMNSVCNICLMTLAPMLKEETEMYPQLNSRTS